MQKPSETRYPALDGLRGIAILMVVAWHYVGCLVTPDAPKLAILAKRLASPMWSGVDLFFVLSGYFIVRILVFNRGSPTYFRAFYVRRAARILPLYAISLGAFVMLRRNAFFAQHDLGWLDDPSMPVWPFTIFMQNLWMSIVGDFGGHWLAVTWSLAVEEQFYLIMPLLVACMSKRGLAILLCVVPVVGTCLRAQYPGFHVELPWRADGLCAGGLLALVQQSSLAEMVKLFGSHRAHFTLFALVGGHALVVGTGAMPRPCVLLSLAIVYGVLVLVLATWHRDWLARYASSRLLVWFGMHSYAIYLMHETVLGFIHAMSGSKVPKIDCFSDVILTILSLLVTCVLAAVSMRVIERPAIRWSHGFSY